MNVGKAYVDIIPRMSAEDVRECIDLAVAERLEGAAAAEPAQTRVRVRMVDGTCLHVEVSGFDALVKMWGDARHSDAVVCVGKYAVVARDIAMISEVRE